MKQITQSEISFNKTDAIILIKYFEFNNKIRMFSLDLANIIDYETPKEAFINEDYGVKLVLKYVKDLRVNLNIMEKELLNKKKELKSVKNIPKMEPKTPSYIG